VAVGRAGAHLSWVEVADQVADSFPVTQELLALMLGVRRATVSASARILQQAGLIR